VNMCEAAIDAILVNHEAFVVDAKQVQDGGV
jgi:hypothetical protein